MIGLVLWITLLGYPALYVFAILKNKTWKARALWCTLLSVPLIAHFWDYPVVYYQHRKACDTDGGLKVFIRPEKTDRIQVGIYSTAEHYLSAYYPAIKAVEANDGTTTNDGVRNYFLYTVDPTTAQNPKVPGRSRGLKLIKTPITPSAKDIYVLRQIHESQRHGGRDRYLLERNGTVYAQWTEYQTIWNAGGVLPKSWQCYTMTGTGRIAYENLVDLLVN